MTTVLTDRPGETFGLALSDGERSDLHALAHRLTHTAPALLDDGGWVALVRTAGCQLPSRLTEVIRAFRHDPGLDGTLTITNLPIAADRLPPTPTVKDSVERTATIAATTAMLLGQQLGEVIAYRDEKHGALVQNVIPVRSLASTQSNGGCVPLELHTENAFHPHRPDYVGLLCLRPAHQDRVGTQVAAIRRALPLLDDADVTTLREARFCTAAPPSFRSADSSSPSAVLLGDAGDPDICVDFHATTALDDKAARALDRLREALVEVRTDLVLRPGDMVFVDNRLVVHGRVAFTPRYDGYDRWLHRVFVHLDHRRSRPARPANGAVLV